MIDWQALAQSLVAVLVAWVIFDVRRLRVQVGELMRDVSYLKGYADAQRPHRKK